jgi:acetyl-CoA acetyltransferase
MAGHPYRDVAIAAVHNTKQARSLDGYTSLSLSCEAALAVLEEAGLDRGAIDGVAGGFSQELTYLLGLGPIWTLPQSGGIPIVAAVANAIAAGVAQTVLIVNAAAGVYTQRGATAPWTRPANEFVVASGLFTTSQFALIARRHMETFGTTPEQLATVAATIRNNGHINPKAVYFGRGPYTPEDVIASRMIAEPYHLLDCCITSEGGSAMIVTTADQAKDLRRSPVYLLGYGEDNMGPAYQHPPVWDLHSTVDPEGFPAGLVGRKAARRAFSMAGLSPNDVSVCEFYDNFSFEVIRLFEAFEFCGQGEGGEFVMGGTIGKGGRFPVSTDGGLLSFSHPGFPQAQALQRVVRGVEQLQGICETNQIPNAEVAMSSNSGSAALGVSTVLLGSERP